MNNPTEKSSNNRPERAGLKTLVTYIPPELSKDLKRIAIDKDTTVQNIAYEAITQWFEAFRRQNAAETTGAQQPPPPVTVNERPIVRTISIDPYIEVPPPPQTKKSQPSHQRPK